MPYDFSCILLTSKNKQVRINEIKDIWTYIDNLVDEAKENNKNGKKFKLLLSIFEQLPFFVCVNNIIDYNCQKAIAKYVYCRDTGTAAHNGSYGEQPGLWMEKYYIIKDALNVREERLQQIARKKQKNEKQRSN